MQLWDDSEEELQMQEKSLSRAAQMKLKYTQKAELIRQKIDVTAKNKVILQNNIQYFERVQRLKIQKAEEIARKEREENICPICYEWLGQGERIILDTCKCVFHLQCIRLAIEADIDKGKIELKCPQDGSGNCNGQLLAQIDVRQIIGIERFNRYLELSLKRAIDTGETLKWCPTPDCGFAFDNEGYSEFICLKCRQHYCLSCGTRMHVGMTCAEFRINNQDDTQILQQLKELNIKQCSRCSYHVERNQGCNHITCRCSHEFCYICGADWKPVRKCNHSLFENVVDQNQVLYQQVHGQLQMQGHYDDIQIVHQPQRVHGGRQFRHHGRRN